MKHIQVDIRDEYDFSDGVRGKYVQAEPVAWQAKFLGGEWYSVLDYEMKHYLDHSDYEHRPLYTRPPASDEKLREAEHTSWCRSSGLGLCTGCSVKKGWDRDGVTGEPTTCQGGAPHEWLPLPCNCGPNDRRRGDRRAALGTQEPEA